MFKLLQFRQYGGCAVAFAIAGLSQTYPFQSLAGSHCLDQTQRIRVFKAIVAAGPLESIYKAGQPPVDAVLAARGILQTFAGGFELLDFREYRADAGHVVTVIAILIGCFIRHAITRAE
ncbi:hypothetical protein D3C76_971120 [compost metagenome]